MDNEGNPTGFDVFVVSFEATSVFAGGAFRSCIIWLRGAPGSVAASGFAVPTDIGAFAFAGFTCATQAGTELDPEPFLIASLEGGLTSWVVTPEPSLSVMLLAVSAWTFRTRRAAHA